MDARGGKLLEFLKENNHLDLEVPDIAFSVKKSEKTVEAALQKLQHSGLVTARQNEYGRVYWYALPSAPITRSFRLDEIKAGKEAGENKLNAMEDEIDLIELQSASSLTYSKNNLPTGNGSNAQSRETIKIATDLQEKVILPHYAPNESFKPESDSIKNEVVDKIEKSTITTDEEKGSIVKDDPDESSHPKFQYSSLQLPAMIIVVLFSLGSLLQSGSIKTRMKSIESAIPTDVVKNTALTPLQNEVNKIGELEKRIITLSNEIDSLKTGLEQINLQRKKVTNQQRKIYIRQKASSQKKIGTRKKR